MKYAFRVWSGGRMLYQDEVYILFGKNGYWECYFDMKDDPYCCSKDEDTALMQFTGITIDDDDSEIEIWEGDIIEDHFGNRGVVKYNEEMGAFCWDHGENWGIIEPNFSELKIVGNIYEHPELLNFL